MATPVATLDDVVDELQILNATQVDILAKLEQIRIILLTTSPQIPLASVLINEFFNREDLDQGGGQGESASAFPPPNNSIYGTAGGFQLDETDPDFPPALEGIHEHERFEFPAIIMTFQQYKDSLA